MSMDIPQAKVQTLEIVGGGPHDGATLIATSSHDVVMAITFTTQPEDEGGWDWQIASRDGAPPTNPHIVNVLRYLADVFEGRQ